MATPFQPSNTALVCLVDPFGVPYKVTGGGGSSVEIQVEGVDTADQTLANFVAGTNVTITNPSGGIIQIDATGIGGGTVTQVNTTAPLTGGPITTTGTIAIPKADATHDGYLSQGDWSTFNGKQAAGNYITSLTGDVTASGPGSAAATLANIPNDTPMAGDLLATAIAAPSTPAAGKGRIYVDSTSKNVAVKDDAGVVKHGVQTKASVASNFLTAISDAGVVSAAQPAFSDISGQIVTSQITDANVTLAKIQNAAASSKLVGSGASGSGAPYSELTLGTNLSMSGTTLNASGGGTTTFSIPGLRLTTESGVPVSTSNRTAQGTLYWTPFISGSVTYYDGAAWQQEYITEQSLALTVTSGKNYDVFYLHGTGLVLSSAWTNDTTRADALGTQNGVTVLSSDHTKLWIGIIRASGANVMADAETQRFLLNAYNRVPRKFKKLESSTGWTYNSATFRPLNNSTANRIEGLFSGQNEIDMVAGCQVWNGTLNTAAWGTVGIDQDGTTVNDADFSGSSGNAGSSAYGGYTQANARYRVTPTAGYHFFQVLESAVSANTVSFAGVDTGSIPIAGILGNSNM